MLSVEEKLDQVIRDEKILYNEVYFEVVRGWYHSEVHGSVILVNNQITTSAERCYVKCHELGHHFMGTVENVLNESASYYDQTLIDRDEYRANRWATEWLMPVEKIIEAYENGVKTPLDLADYMSIPLEELCNGISIYYKKYGPYKDFGQYRIFWNPFNIKKDRRRRK